MELKINLTDQERSDFRELLFNCKELIEEYNKRQKRAEEMALIIGVAWPVNKKKVRP